MLGVSAVAWSLLLLAELGWFRLGLVAFLVAVTMIGFGLRGVLRAVPPAPAAAGGGLQPALAAAAGILLCAALFLPPYHTEMAAGDATVYPELRPADRPPWRARVRGSAAAPTVARQPCRAVPESGAPRHDGPVCGDSPAAS